MGGNCLSRSTRRSKHWQPLMALRGDVDDFQTLINQTRK
jgi:hypothetical protein